MKIIITVFVLCIAQSNCCKNLTKCVLEDQLGFLLQDTSVCHDDNGALIKYILYTTEGKKEIQSNSVIDNSKPIKLILPGQGANGDTNVIYFIISKYLKIHGDKYHILVPDYAVYFPQNSRGVYGIVGPLCNVTHVSYAVSQFLHNLVLTNDINPQNIHVVGSSLGGQICGFVGYFFEQLSNQKVGRITGLDPAGVGFTCPSYPECRLDETDGTFVDIIYTDYGFSGVSIKSAHTQFLVNNGGAVQPGCEMDDFILGHSCNHLRSNIVFGESIEFNNFKGHCITDPSDEEVVYMGEYCRKRPKCNTFNVVTKGESPFGVDPSGPIS